MQDDKQRRLALSPARAAEMLDVSRITVWRLIQAGELRVFHVSKRCTRITMASLEAYMAERLEAEAS